MRNGLAAGPLEEHRIYAPVINQACMRGNGFSPLVAYAIAYRETISGEINGSWNAATVVSSDGGHGLFQLTSSWPEGWFNPLLNAEYAVDNFLLPAEDFWANQRGMQGEDLVRCIAAEFNAGRRNALLGHQAGNVDMFTTDRYAAAVLKFYTCLCDKLPLG